MKELEVSNTGNGCFSRVSTCERVNRNHFFQWRNVVDVGLAVLGIEHSRPMPRHVVGIKQQPSEKRIPGRNLVVRLCHQATM